LNPVTMEYGSRLLTIKPQRWDMKCGMDWFCSEIVTNFQFLTVVNTNMADEQICEFGSTVTPVIHTASVK
jgi:hypothetical protein